MRLPTPRPELIDLPDSLIGDKVMLRPYRRGDGKVFFESVDKDREHLATWVAWVDQYKSVDDAEAYVRRMQSKWAARTALIVGIFSRDGSRHYGGTGFHAFDWDVPAFELGYFLRKDGARTRLLQRSGLDGDRLGIRASRGEAHLGDV